MTAEELRWADTVRLYARWDQHLLLTPKHLQTECEHCRAFMAERQAQITAEREAS